MKADLLLAHYERIADAPDAPTRLRRLVLDLAVRGKLVAQNPRDEPATVLLERISNLREYETERMIPKRVPFDVPATWAWARLGALCTKTGSGSTPRGGRAAYHSEGVPFLRSQNVHDDGLHLNDVAYIDRETHRRMKGTAVKPNDLLLNITGGSIGRCCIVPNEVLEANVSQHVAIVRVAVAGTQTFLHWLILSPYFQAFVLGRQTGAGRGGLPKRRMDEIPVALPPLAEQHRIVAKVDEMMALCDALEAARKEREAARDRLAAATLARLKQPDLSPFLTDAHFAIDNLGILTKRPDQIKQLRETVLDLAVRGKLVPQDPNDEPAQELLERIAKEKVNVSQTDLPRGWGQLPLGGLVIFQYGKGLKKSERADKGPVPVFGSNGMVGFTDSRLTDRPAIIVGRKGSAGALNLCDGPSWTTDVAYYVESPSFIGIRFLLLALRSMDLDRLARGVKPGLSRSAAYMNIMRVPPLAEQHRIVTKVDELMTLCDQLERRLSEAAALRSRVFGAILTDATAAA